MDRTTRASANASTIITRSFVTMPAEVAGAGPQKRRRAVGGRRDTPSWARFCGPWFRRYSDVAISYSWSLTRWQAEENWSLTSRRTLRVVEDQTLPILDAEKSVPEGLGWRTFGPLCIHPQRKFVPVAAGGRTPPCCFTMHHTTTRRETA